MSQIQVKMRQGGQLKDIPFGCNCNGSGGMDNGELAAVQKELEALGGNIAAVQAGLKATQDEQALIRQELERRDKTAVNIYVGGSGAGDSLIDGRGLVPELPFETLNMALYYTIGKNLASYCNFYIQGDLEENVLSSGANNSFAINLIKGSGLQNNPRIILKNTLYFSQGFISTDGIDFEKIENGDVIDVGIRARLHFNSGKIKGNNGVVTVSNNGNAKFYNASFEMSNGGQLLYVNNFGDVALQGNITLNGECSAAGILGARAARILIADTRLTFSGDVVGKKYMMGAYSALILNGIPKDNIPGTLAGVCDESSTVA